MSTPLPFASHGSRARVRERTSAMKRIFDPIHRFIELDENEIALLDTAPVQRLRRLRQLGLAYLAFPAAEHSRFGHALGALAFGERIMTTLRASSPWYFADATDFSAQRRLLRASLLLHDIGHGPFSHACEAVLGQPHEKRTADILARPEIVTALARLDVDPHDVLALVVGDPRGRYPVLREIVSGPNLDADRMDYLLRDSYFTGAVGGSFDYEQLVASLRVYENAGTLALGVDVRGVVALESFVLARYLMFSTVYFHHTTRQFERILQAALRETWPDPRALDDIDEFLTWDDFRVLESFRFATSRAARAVRDRETLYALVAESNSEPGSATFEACETALRAAYGDAVWADSQEQLMHRLPMGSRNGAPTILVGTYAGTTRATEVSDLIARMTGSAHWRKLYVERSRTDVAGARELCRRIAEKKGKHPDVNSKTPS